MAKVGLVLALCFAAAIALPLQQGGDGSIALLSEVRPALLMARYMQGLCESGSAGHCAVVLGRAA